MMRSLTARVLQPFRRLMLWLTGNRALHEKMDVLNGLLVAMPQLIEAAMQRTAAAEFDRVNEILVSQINALRTDLGESIRASHTMLENVHTHLNNMDTKLDDMHVISLHEKVDGLWTAVHALSNASAEAVGNQLIDEMDRLDGSILHHMAALRAVLLTGRQSDEASAGRTAPDRS